MLTMRLTMRMVATVAALTAFVFAPAFLPAAEAQVPRTIRLTSPRPGSVVAAPIEVGGRVTVAPFENNLRGRVYDRSGRVVGEGPVAVTPDDPETYGGPGSFAARIPVTAGVAGPVRVEVADLSAADGSVLARASVEVRLGPTGLPATGSGPVAAQSLAAALGLALLSLGAAIRRRPARVA
jgi:hypothetical protein